MATNPMSKRFLEITDGENEGKIMVEVTIGNCILRRWPTEKEATKLKAEGVSVMKAVTSDVAEMEEGGLVIDKPVAPKEEKKKATGAKKEPKKAPKAPVV